MLNPEDKTMPNETDSQAKVWQLMQDIGICMLVTKTGGGLRSRPVAAHPQEDVGIVYVLTDVRGHKDDEVESNPDVCLAFAHPGDNAYVSLTGRATVADDRSKIRELWNVFAKAWWSSPDDPNIRLLKIEPQSAEYWDSPGKIVASAIMAFKAITGAENKNPGENKKVAM